MGILDKIADIEKEIAKTQKNKGMSLSVYKIESYCDSNIGSRKVKLKGLL